MKNLDPSSALGPDNIPAFFYKDYAEELVYLIIKIWRFSLDTGLLPEGTAQPIITPIYKGGDKDKPERKLSTGRSNKPLDQNL